jgi:uncharacterized protein (TIRG00374 family)
MRKILSFLRIVISAALLAALIWMMKDQLSDIGAIIITANKFLIALSIALIITGMIIQSYRLKFLLDAQEIHLSIKDIIRLTFMGHFFNNFMPTAIGGDVIKGYFVSGGTKKKLETYASIAIDRMLGVITLMWIALVAIAFNYSKLRNKLVILIIAVIFIAGILFTALIFNERAARFFLFLKKALRKFKLDEKMQRLYEATNNYRHHKALIFKALWLSLAAQLVYFFVIYILGVSISGYVPFMFFMLILPLISTVSMLPSINGLGIRESGFIYFLGDAMGREKAFALSLLYLGAILFISLIGGVLFLINKEFNHIQVVPRPETPVGGDTLLR